MMKNVIYLLLLTFLFIGCSDSSNPVNVIISYKPIYPQPGYNARNTSNPYCINTTMNPVQFGKTDWSFTFPGTSFSDGSEFCVDSKGNIYYVSQPYQIGGLYKFSQNGDVIWKKDSLIQWNFCGISLSANEERIYVVAFKEGGMDTLYCIDSTGKTVWSMLSHGFSKPVIGKSGTLYTFLKVYALTAISADGNILWENPSITDYTGKYHLAIDLEDNIYVVNRDIAILKIDKYGGIIWQNNTGYDIYGVVLDGYGNIYYNDIDNRRLYCLDNSGKLKWTKEQIFVYSTPVISSDNKVIVSAGSGIVAYDTSGTQIWSSQVFGAENIILDDFDNVYYLIDDHSQGIIVGSVSSSGIKRWDYINSGLYITLPPPVLIPSGKLLFAPKRAFKIQAIM